jgi:hypothetical protein
VISGAIFGGGKRDICWMRADEGGRGWMGFAISLRVAQLKNGAEFM